MEGGSCSAESTLQEGGSNHAESDGSGYMGQNVMSGQGVGVGTMQYQGSGMAPHAPLHPESPEGSGSPGGINHSSESAAQGNFEQAQGMAGQPQMMSGMASQGMAGQPQMMSGMTPQGMAGQPQMMSGMMPQGMAGQPQMMSGMVPQGMAGQPQMMSGMVPQGMVGQPQMMSGMVPQGMAGQPQMMSGMMPQGMVGQPQMTSGMAPQGTINPQQNQQSAIGDMNRYGQYLEVFTDMANGKTPELPQLAQMVEQAPGDFWKGAIVGAAAGFIFTSETVREGIGSVIASVFSGIGSADDSEE